MENEGDVALPGGKMEESDEDDTATALREAMEEIGLDPSLVHVVLNLEPFISQVVFFETQHFNCILLIFLKFGKKKIGIE